MVLKNVTKFHKILIKVLDLESGHCWTDVTKETLNALAIVMAGA